MQAAGTAVKTEPRQFRVPVCLELMLYTRDRYRPAVGSDLSATGMFVRTEKPLNCGITLGLELPLDGVAYFVLARVVRTTADGGAGLEFVDLPRDAQLAVVEYTASRRFEIESKELRARQGLRTRDAGPQPRTARPTRPASQPGRRGRPERRSLVAAGVKGATGLVARVPLLPILWGLCLSAVVSVLGCVGYIAATSLPPSTPEPAPLAAAAPVPLEPAAPEPAEVTPAAAQVTETSDKNAEWADALVAEADELFRSGKWSLPEGECALDSYQEALELDPNHAAARAGVALICDSYGRRAREQLDKGDLRGAHWRLSRALEILTSHPARFAVATREARAAGLRSRLRKLEPQL